ncbi:MAG: precorrin-6y C5,15-methyltransferase (decarboxylating) subunit CbiE [Syntrophobacteraceae bacterium]
MKPAEWKPPTIAVIGMGGGRQYLGSLAMEWIAEAQVLAGAGRHLESFKDLAGERLIFKSPLSESIEEIASLSQTKRIAVICSGDPLFFGIAKTLAKRLGSRQLVVIPNVTSIQMLCAASCESWDLADTVSFHGVIDDWGMERIVEILQRGRKAAVLTDPKHTPQWIARGLIGPGLPACRIVIGEDLGAPSQRVRSFSPSQVADCKDFSPLNVLIIVPEQNAAPDKGAKASGRIFGFSEEAFERDAGMITKMEVRAAVLATLSLEDGQVLWDLGAATGSVSIEAARIARLKQVFAIEKDPSRFAKLVQNIEKFEAFRVKAICAKASEAMGELASPDRVFIGGGGSDLGAILKGVHKRLKENGLIVQTAVLFETLEEAARFWKEHGFRVSIVQLQVNRSVPTGNDVRLEALNPVFILSARRQ